MIDSLLPYRRPFQTADGFICVIPYNGLHWASFLEFVGLGDIAQADWVQDSVRRSENVGKLYKIISDVMPQRNSTEWLEELRQRDVPCAPVNRLDDLFNDSHLKDVEFFKQIDHPSEGKLKAVRSPFRVRGVKEVPDRCAPRLGEHNDSATWKKNK